MADGAQWAMGVHARDVDKKEARGAGCALVERDVRPEIGSGTAAQGGGADGALDPMLTIRAVPPAVTGFSVLDSSMQGASNPTNKAQEDYTEKGSPEGEPFGPFRLPLV